MSAEKLCPACGVGNPATNRYYGQCGSGLRFHAVEEKRPAIIDESGTLLPALNTRQIARTLAISAAALTAELAIVYLKRRLNRERELDAAMVRQSVEKKPVNREHTGRLRKAGTGLLTGAVMIFAERQLTELENGRPVRQLIERTFYRRDAQ
jgi:hypothetical protein